jgi:hypothetical protein
VTGRVVDPTRQGGTGNAAPKEMGDGGGLLSVEEALAYRDNIAWRQFRPRADKAVIALAEEVERLRVVNANQRALVELSKSLFDDAQAEVERFRAALSEIIGCACDAALNCTRDAYSWGVCCCIRNRMVKIGLLPAAERVAEEDDAA